MTLTNVLNVLKFLNVLNLPKDPSLACWALFLFICPFIPTPLLPGLKLQAKQPIVLEWKALKNTSSKVTWRVHKWFCCTFHSMQRRFLIRPLSFVNQDYELRRSRCHLDSTFSRRRVKHVSRTEWKTNQNNHRPAFMLKCFNQSISIAFYPLLTTI